TRGGRDGGGRGQEPPQSRVRAVGGEGRRRAVPRRPAQGGEPGRFQPGPGRQDRPQAPAGSGRDRPPQAQQRRDAPPPARGGGGSRQVSRPAAEAWYRSRRDSVTLDPALNPPQRGAVLHGDGPLLVLAGAGSGKTRVLPHRIASLVDRGVPAGRILAVTFTNKAAGEMRERLHALLGDRGQGMWIGTFHSVCARLLRIHAPAVGLTRDSSIFNEDDQRK